MTTTEFKLPDVGEGLEEAEIVEWLVAIGDDVRRDQPLVEILTDKSQTQLPSPVAGTVVGLEFAEGDIAHVGQVLVTIDSTDSASPPADLQTERAVPETPVPATASTAMSAGPDPASSMNPVRPKASPAIRRRALEAGIDLSTVTGTGPGGRIIEADLDSSGEARSTDRPQPTQARDGLGQMAPGHHRLRGIRRATAVAMGRSWEIPHIHGSDELDATGLMSGRDRIRELYPERGASLTPLAFFVMAVAQALRRYPLVNATIDVEAGEIIVHDHVNIGLAVATDAGLVVPVIDDADRMDLFEIANAITLLGIAARDRSITGEQMRGGTCTITNYGSFGGRDASPIIRAPEVAIVGFGSIKERPIVVDGAVVARKTLPVVIAADHRLIDGDLMAAFQQHIMTVLLDPVALMVR